MGTNITITTPELLQTRYRYIRLLGEGSNGKTWLSRDLQDGSDVAIKELKDYKDFKQLDLFTREIEFLKSIHTKGVPEYRDSIQGEDEFYLVEEFVPYPSLQQLLDEGTQFDEKTVLTILSRTAAILHVLETQYHPPIIHRDIKPSNLMINRRGAYEMEIHLIDFGSVVLPEKSKEGSTIAGTFGYMPPEQLQGHAVIQSDFYALGATALHLLTGVSPVDIESEVFNLKFEPVITEHAPETSHGTVDLLRSLLSPKIEDRPRSAQALIETINQLLNQLENKTQVATNSPLSRLIKKLTESSFYKRHFAPQNASPKKQTRKDYTSKTANARIEQIRVIDKLIDKAPHGFLEYSFQVDEKTYAGFINIDTLSLDSICRDIDCNNSFIIAYIDAKTPSDFVIKTYPIPLPKDLYNQIINIIISKTLLIHDQLKNIISKTIGVDEQQESGFKLFSDLCDSSLKKENSEKLNACYDCYELLGTVIRLTLIIESFLLNLDSYKLIDTNTTSSNKNTSSKNPIHELLYAIHLDIASLNEEIESFSKNNAIKLPHHVTGKYYKIDAVLSFFILKCSHAKITFCIYEKIFLTLSNLIQSQICRDQMNTTTFNMDQLNKLYNAIQSDTLSLESLITNFNKVVMDMDKDTCINHHAQIQRYLLTLKNTSKPSSYEQFAELFKTISDYFSLLSSYLQM